MTKTRFTPDLDLDGISPDEAFAVLGNETRLEIIRVLWCVDAAHQYDDGSDTVKTISYSELQYEVGIDDNGKFNYHLSELAPHFVRRTDEGYRLSGAGKQIARTVVAVSGVESLDFSAKLDDDCPLCGADLAATYDDQWLRIRCTECDGLFGDQAPTGTLFLTNYPAAGLTNRDPEQALATGLYRCALDITYLMYGICRECAAPISSSVTVCDAHESQRGKPCANCGTPFPVWADMGCDTCGFAKRLPVEMFVTGLIMATRMIACNEKDVRALSFREAVDLLQNKVETSISEDPFRISATVTIGPTPFTVVLDDDMTIIGFSQSSEADVVTS